MRIEVFKTDVSDPARAQMLLDLIHATFSEYAANFDLEDCDRILRVVSTGLVDTPLLMHLLESSGVQAEVLSDDIPEMFHL